MTQGPDVERIEFEGGWIEISDERVRGVLRIEASSLPSIYAGSTPLHGLDNPEPIVRVAADEQRDYGDEDRNAR